MDIREILGTWLDILKNERLSRKLLPVFEVINVKDINSSINE